MGYQINTYSYLDLNGSITSPLAGILALNGTGIVSLKLSPQEDIAKCDTAADGSQMLSLMANPPAMFTIEVQQQSASNLWLQGLYNAQLIAPSVTVAQTAITVQSTLGSYVGVTLKNCMIKRQADLTYAREAGNFSWEFICANPSAFGSFVSALTQAAAQVIGSGRVAASILNL